MKAIRTFLRLPLPLAMLFLAVSCSNTRSDDSANMSAAGSAARSDAGGGWQLLLQRGEDLSLRWRGYQVGRPPASWSIVDNTLAFAPGAERGDLMTRESYGDFELQLEWKISRGGNSGVIYRVSPTGELPWHTGLEMQVLDDDEHPDARLGMDRNRTAGALYDLVGTPPGVVRAVGDWNEARIVAVGNRVEHWLNGQKVVDLEIGSDRWNGLLEASKFRAMAGFGVQSPGHVVLQDHGNPVWYRNIRVRRLD